MAASRKSKFSDRLEVQDRFRINLESIINKYDKPFEDSPILDLHKMSSVSDSLQELNFFRPFGWTPLATDLQKGKKRKGGVSCDSALGSTISPKSNESEESIGNINLQNYDFTHETSDSVGAFIRYKHHSLSKNPEIVGLKKDEKEDDESFESDDDLGSVCSGPTSAPYLEDKYTERIRDNEEDMIEVNRTRQTDNDISLEERSPEDKVRSWLSDDAFMNTSRHGNMHEDPDVSVTEGEELSQESEYPSTLSEGEQDEAKSLLEIKERFVRRVKSMLVEGNNETDDISSSADENVGFSQKLAVERTEGQTINPRTVNVSGGERDRSSYPNVQNELGEYHSMRLFKEPLSSTICHEASTARGNQDGFRKKPMMLSGDETTIIAGHFDDDVVISPEYEDERQAGTNSASVQKGFELVQSPGGKMEWTSAHGRSDLARKALPFRTRHVQKKIEFQDSSQPSSCLTPKKTMLASGITERTFKTPQGKCKLPFKSHISKSTEDRESPQGIISEIMDFFKSPLPELLTSPMPILSSKGRLRTAQGKAVIRNTVSKPADIGKSCPSAVTVQGSSPLMPKQSQSSREFRQPMSPGSPFGPEQPSHKSIVTAECTIIDRKSSNLQLDNTLNTTQGPHGVQEIHGELYSVDQSMSTEEEGDISLFTEDSTEESPTFQCRSPSRFTSESQSPKSPTQHCHLTSKLVKVPKTPTQLSIPANKLEKVSKTPGITSPFSRMHVNSAEKDQAKVRHVQEKGMRNNLPRPYKSLVFGERNLRDSRDGSEDKPDMELLVISSSDDDDDELEYKMEEEGSRYRPKISKGKDLSHQYSLVDKSGAKERQGSKYKGNVAIDSVEQLSYRCTEETRTGVQACNKVREFDQTYIIADRGKKTPIPRHMSPSRYKIEKDQRQWKKIEHRSSCHTIQCKVGHTKEDERKSNELKHKYSSPHKIREDYSNPTTRDGTRTASVETVPVMTNKDNRHRMRQNKDRVTILQGKGCSFNRLHNGSDEASKAKDRNSAGQGVKTNDQHSRVGRVSDRSDSTFVSNPGYSNGDPTRKENRNYVDNEDSRTPRTEKSLGVVTEENKLSAPPRTKSKLLSHTIKSKFAISDETKDKHEQKPLAKQARVSDSLGRSDVRLKSRHQKMVLQEDRHPIGRAVIKLRDISFLSSTRIDEAELNSQDLNRTVSSRLRREEQPVGEKPTKKVPRMHEEAVWEKPLEVKGQTPSKRRRQGSDRANSLESPAKKQANARRSLGRGSKTLDRSIGNRRMLDSSDDEEIEGKEWNDESVSSLSSMCEGPGRCSKRICFKCAMNE